MSLCTPINPASVLHPAGYMLWWEVSGVESSREERSLSNSTLQYQLTSLTSTTAYTLQVAALTAAGQGAATSSTISTGVPPGRTAQRTLKPARSHDPVEWMLKTRFCVVCVHVCVLNRVNMTDELRVFPEADKWLLLCIHESSPTHPAHTSTRTVTHKS